MLPYSNGYGKHAVGRSLQCAQAKRNSSVTTAAQPTVYPSGARYSAGGRASLDDTLHARAADDGRSARLVRVA